MTGIERLRAIAGAWNEWGLGGALAEIADEIERERDAEVADSPYDAILPEDREAIAWVREHGGIDYVRAELRSRVPRERYERMRQSLLRHIAEREAALGRRREVISELTHRVSELTNENAELRRRAMPEGMEWPRFEDGEKLTLDNAPIGVEGVEFPLDASGYALCCGVGPKRFRFCERIKRHVGGYFQKSRKVASSLTSHSDASDVYMSAYDLLPQEERDAIACKARAKWNRRAERTCRMEAGARIEVDE